MLRLIALAAVWLAVPAFAHDLPGPHHGSQVIGSYSVPFNYRPQGETYIVRTQVYDENRTKTVRVRRTGLADNPTGDTVTEIFVTSPYADD